MEHGGFCPSGIKVACESVNALKPLVDIDGYNNEMTISQVVRFFERQGISFTKTTIQYYVRNNVIPPPRDKRYYSKIHLLMLHIIGGVKDVYSVDEMKRFFNNFLPVDSEMNGSEMYRSFMELYRTAVSEWTRTVDGLISVAEQFIVNSHASVGADEMEGFAVIMMLMAQSAANKKAVQKLIEEKN